MQVDGSGHKYFYHQKRLTMTKSKTAVSKTTVKIIKVSGGVQCLKVRSKGKTTRSEPIDITEANKIIKKLGLKSQGKPTRENDGTTYTYA